eukprot:TRINITY_DN34879_c0_g1_i1.p1 TRINITY_DN34879_c0_g1~~TRINITY_DN34879_c0_g1_i1.p1  ORF type:complete len:1712 (+),score=250.74 TRINITY_DN34879_c0_g1_i1:175-5310(+)
MLPTYRSRSARAKPDSLLFQQDGCRRKTGTTPVPGRASSAFSATSAMPRTGYDKAKDNTQRKCEEEEQYLWEQRALKTSRGIWRLRSRLEHLTQRLDDRCYGSDLICGTRARGSMLEMELTDAMQSQLRSEIDCLEWISHTIVERDGVSAALSRLFAARSLQTWRSEATKLDQILRRLEQSFASQSDGRGVVATMAPHVRNGNSIVRHRTATPTSREVRRPKAPLLEPGELAPSRPTTGISDLQSSVGVPLASSPGVRATRHGVDTATAAVDAVSIDTGSAQSCGSMSKMLQGCRPAEKDRSKCDQGIVGADVGQAAESCESSCEQSMTLEVKTHGVEPDRRGISAGQLMFFFEKYCGVIIEEEVHGPQTSDSFEVDGQSLVCLPVKLAELCVREHQHVDASHLRPRSGRPDTYAAVDLIIRPETQIRERTTSYSEKLNPDGLALDYFVSHCWGEDFGEFTQSILRYARVACDLIGARSWKHVSFWCCAFSVNQNSPQGSLLACDKSHGPPVRAVLNSWNCRGTVISLGRFASALGRSWCLYELHLTRTLKKDLVMTSSFGPLMDAIKRNQAQDLWIVGIFKLLDHFDASNAKASSETVRQHVINTVGVDALNDSMRSSMAELLLPTLVRRDDIEAVTGALRMRADPEKCDASGLRPLTYATTNSVLFPRSHEDESSVNASSRTSLCMHSTVESECISSGSIESALLASGADKRAQTGASQLLSMWSADKCEREKAIEGIGALPASVLGYHVIAWQRAREWHSSICARQYVADLDSLQAEVRVQGLCNLGEVGEGAVPHVHRILACVADENPLVQITAVETLGKCGTGVEVADWRIPRGCISEACVAAHHPRFGGGSLLHFAAREYQDTAMVILALAVAWSEEGKPMLEVDANGQNPAHIAVLRGHAASVPVLASLCRAFEPALMRPDIRGRCGIHHAADVGSCECLAELLELKRCAGHLDATDRDGCTALHIAAAAGHLDFVRALLQAGFPQQSLLLPTAVGQNVVHTLVAGGDGDFIRDLVRDFGLSFEAFEALDEWNRSPAHLAVICDRAEALLAILEVGGSTCARMGPSQSSQGSCALVPQLCVAAGGSTGDEASEFRVGRVVYGADRHGNVRFEYQNGYRDSRLTPASQCLFAPTPWMLAQLLDSQLSRRVLQDRWRAALPYLSKEAPTWLWQEAASGATLVGAVSNHEVYRAAEALHSMVRDGVLTSRDFQVRDSEGRSAVLRAAFSGRVGTVKAVVELGALSSDARRVCDDLGRNALHHAVEGVVQRNCGEEERRDVGDFLKAILELCFDDVEDALNVPDFYFSTLAHLAAAANSITTIKALWCLNAAMDKPMGGPLKLRLGAVAWVSEESLNMGRLGQIQELLGDPVASVHVKYLDGTVGSNIAAHRCVVAPTPLQLAKVMGHGEAAQALHHIMKETSVSSPTGFGTMQQASRHLVSTHASASGEKETLELPAVETFPLASKSLSMAAVTLPREQFARRTTLLTLSREVVGSPEMRHSSPVCDDIATLSAVAEPAAITAETEGVVEGISEHRHHSNFTQSQQPSPITESRHASKGKSRIPRRDATGVITPIPPCVRPSTGHVTPRARKAMYRHAAALFKQSSASLAASKSEKYVCVSGDVADTSGKVVSMVRATKLPTPAATRGRQSRPFSSRKKRSARPVAGDLEGRSDVARSDVAHHSSPEKAKPPGSARRGGIDATPLVD